MLSYVIHSQDIEQVLEIVYNVLRIAVSFYDIDFNELSFMNEVRTAPYCFAQRQHSSFLAHCKRCDKEHFDQARVSGQILIYRCHCGLYDGLVPLYNEQGQFLGSIIFGQVRPKGRPNPHRPDTPLAGLYDKLPAATKRKMAAIGRLLKLTTELIVQQRMVEFRRLGWSDQLRKYIDAHIHLKLTLKDLAEMIGKSPSFLTHHFRAEFGMSLTEYIKKRKMETALGLLKAGVNVNRAAQKLGFYDAYHFSRTFKQHFGQPPKFYHRIAVDL